MRRTIIGFITALSAAPVSAELDRQVSGLDFLRSARNYLTVSEVAETLSPNSTKRWTSSSLFSMSAECWTA